MLRVAAAVLLILACVASAERVAADRGRADLSVRGQAPVGPLPVPLPPFDEWLSAVRTEAETRGIRPDVLDAAFTGLTPVLQILERDRTQAEFTLDLEAYLKRRLTRETVRTAQQMHTRHRAVLTRIARKYGVSSKILVAIWGLESNFGRFPGVRPTIPVLATLAYDARRSIMFREELFSALEILNRGDIQLEHLKGSWAGALGQPQFMPSNYLVFAQDFDGDGRRDIWASLPDVFASIAYFLHEHGWAAGRTWGREVKIASPARDAVASLRRRASGCRAERLMTDPQPLDAWRKLGVRSLGGAPLPRGKANASLVEAGSRRFLLHDNYEALLGYNCAHTYALSVGLLSDRIQ